MYFCWSAMLQFFLSWTSGHRQPRDMPELCRAATSSSTIQERAHVFSTYFPDYSLHPGSQERPTDSFPYNQGDALSTSQEPLVSVVIPFYNSAAETFWDTIASVTRSSLQQFEVIVVNDASTLESAMDLLKEFDLRYKDDERFRILRHLENRGLSAARNTGFHHAKSNFVMILDTDDMIEPTALEKNFWYLATRPEAGFVKGFTIGR